MEERSGRLFVLGSFVMACCAGVDRLPGAGESLIARSFSAEPGGKGYNVAAGASRLGAVVDCMIAVGHDMFGALAETALQKAGLSTRFLQRCAMPTGAGIGFIHASGENCLAVFPGANLGLEAKDVRAAAAAVSTAAMVIAQFEIADAPIIEAFALARAAGHATLLNASPFRMPAPDILAKTTILVVNETEAAALARAFDAGLDLSHGQAEGLSALAVRVHASGVESLIVTLGECGAWAFAHGSPALFQPAFAVETRDTLGAGDAFTAAFAVSLVEGRTQAEALRRAAAAGAIMASRLGTFDAFPDRVAIDRCIRDALRPPERNRSAEMAP